MTLDHRSSSEEGEVPASPAPDAPAALPEGVHAPLQARSRRTLERIVQAALRLFSRGGVEGTSVHAIVDEAGSSVGSFYARFDGKEELVRFLEARVWDDALTRWQEGMEGGRWEEGSLDRVVDGVVQLLLRTERTDADQRRVLSRDAPSASGAARFRTAVRGDVRRLLLARRSEITHPDPAGAVDLLFAVLVGGVRELVREELDPETGELSRLALSYLRPRSQEAAPGPAEDDMDFFDVWS